MSRYALSRCQTCRRISISILRQADQSDRVAQIEQPQQGRRQGRDENRRRGGRRGSKGGGFDNLPTSYVDDQARSSISDMAEIRTVTEAGSKLLDNVRREDQKANDSDFAEDEKEDTIEDVAQDAVEMTSDIEEAVKPEL